MNELMRLDDALIDDYSELVMSTYRHAETHWTALRGRQQSIRSLISGDWGEVFSEDFATQEDLPMVANTFRKHAEDIGHLFGQSEPTERVPPDGHDEEPALKRERILVAYNARSRWADSLEYYGMDMAAGGYMAIKVWPQLKTTGAKRFPTFSRLDPLTVLPPVNWNPAAPTDDVFVHYAESLDRLRMQFPEQIARLETKILESFLGPRMYSTMAEAKAVLNPAVRVVEFYSTRFIARFVMVDCNGQRHYEMLVYRPNDTGICPIQIAYRPSWSDEPTGQLDDSKGIVRGKHRAWVMLLDYFVQMVYGGKLAWNVMNPNEKGPNTTYRALSADAFMKPVTPEAPAFQALQLFGQMDAEERLDQVRPAAREGEAPLNKATAAYLTRSQGELTDVVKSYYKNSAAAKQVANEAAFAQDEKWCGGTDKKIFGIARGRRFAETYTPAKDIDGDWDSVVSYGPSSGIDQPTMQVMNQNKLQLGAMSIETFLEQDPSVTEPGEEISRIRAQAIENGYLSSLAAKGDLAAQAEALLALKEGDPIEDIIKRAQAQQRQAQQAMLPATAGAAPTPAGASAPNPTAASGAEGAEGANVPLPSGELLRAGAGGR